MKYIIGMIVVCCLELSISYNYEDGYRVRERRQISKPSTKRLVCYHNSWAARRNVAVFRPADIDPFLCTHLLYAYALPDLETGITSFDFEQDIQLEGYVKFTNLKKLNPNLNVILSVGGGKGSSKFSRIADDPKLRKKFVERSKSYLEQYNFTGLDIVWKYPSFSEGSIVADKKNYVLLLQELRNAFGEDFTISIAVPPFGTVIDLGFDLPQISKIVDFMTVLTYNYHSATEAFAFHSAPLYQIPQDAAKELNVDAGIANYLKRGVDPEKLNLATNLDGLSYILDDPNDNELGAFVEDEGSGTQEPGLMVYNHLCEKIRNENWTVVHVNKSAIGPYAYKGKQWVSYDDEDMIRTKARYAVEKGLGGLMFWSIDMDDFEMKCHPKTFPLIRAAGEEIGLYSHLNDESVLSNVTPVKKSTIMLRWTPSVPFDLSPTMTPFLNTTSSANKLLFSTLSQPGKVKQIQSTSFNQVQIEPSSPSANQPSLQILPTSSLTQTQTSLQIKPTPSQIQPTFHPVTRPQTHSESSPANQPNYPLQNFPQSISHSQPHNQPATTSVSQSPSANQPHILPQNYPLSPPTYYPPNQPYYQPQNFPQNVPQNQNIYQNPSYSQPSSSNKNPFPNYSSLTSTSQVPHNLQSSPPNQNTYPNHPSVSSNYQSQLQNSQQTHKLPPPSIYHPSASSNQQRSETSQNKYHPNSMYSNRDVVIFHSVNIMTVYNQ